MPRSCRDHNLSVQKMKLDERPERNWNRASRQRLTSHKKILGWRISPAVSNIVNAGSLRLIRLTNLRMVRLPSCLPSVWESLCLGSSRGAVGRRPERRSAWTSDRWSTIPRFSLRLIDAKRLPSKQSTIQRLPCPLGVDWICVAG